MPNYLVYHLGSDDQVYECAYSILKYLQVYNIKPPQDDTLVVYTSRPEILEAYASFFNRFELKELQGTGKTESLRNFFAEHKGNMLYLDSNTYPVSDLSSVFSSIARGKIFASGRTQVSDQASSGTLEQMTLLGMKCGNGQSLDAALQEKTSVPMDIIARYDHLREFRLLLRDFFKRYQEESVPNQVKLIHCVDAKQIEDQKKRFLQLPFYQRFLRKMAGKAWNIANYKVKL
ncbi:MAG: hypothetical protein ACJ75B_02805 [Flavisolibacter sp.]